MASKYSTQVQNNELPFRAALDFTPVIEQWKEKAKNGSPGQSMQAQEVLDMVESNPFLAQEISSVSELNGLEKEVALLLSDLFPAPLQKNEIKAACFPFDLVPFNLTERMQGIWETAGGNYKFKMEESGDLLPVFGGLIILAKFYGVSLQIHKPWTISIPNLDTRITHHYRVLFNADFIDILGPKELPEITEEQIKSLRNNSIDPEKWIEIIKPELFKFVGIAILSLVDITTEHSLSLLKGELLSNESTNELRTLEPIEKHVRNLLKLPDVKMGLTEYDAKYKRLVSIKEKGIDSFLVQDGKNFMKSNSFLSKVVKQYNSSFEPYIIEDLELAAKHCTVSESVLKQGMGSIIIAPLVSDDHVFGMVEIASPNPGDLNALTAIRLKELLPLLTASAERGIEQRHAKIQGLIKNKFTSIHPSVEWKFEEVATNLLKRQLTQGSDEVEPIVFDGIVPLFGQSDIRGSSNQRNLAVKADLTKQLNLAQNIISNAHDHLPAFAFEEIQLRINNFINKMDNGLQAGDEMVVQEFFKFELEPLFKHLSLSEEVDPEVLENYYSTLDPISNMVYDKRKLYEKSVTMLNDCIGTTLERRQEEAQAIFPHYFEKYKTDGVEYNMYIGGSIAPERQYHPIYLKNLRLWQLVTMCEVVQNTANKLKTMPVPLQVASLILTQNAPLSIRFRMDEKQFDVDGTYNVRYEIVKKRIDKAHIKETGERLTQPDKIAIVYSQEKEIAEYNKYFAYLKSLNLIEDEIEQLELDDLPGANGLKALRFTVKVDNPDQLKNKEVEDMIKAIA